MKRILVTGGAGFIGSHLCKNLLDAGNQVYCLDNFFTGHKKNIANIQHNRNFSLIEHDVKEKFFIDVDEIYNLACPASPKNYQIDPVDTIQTCVLGAINVLSLAKSCDAKILQTSTSEVYGDPLLSPQTEEYWGNVNPLGPRSCYDEGKRCAESLFINYHEEYNTQIKIARIFNTFGPNLSVDDGRVISNFIVQSLVGKDITIYGTGEQTRSFCYVDDTVRGLIALMETDRLITGPVNIGNPQEFSVNEIANKIINLTGSLSKIIFCKNQIDDPKRRLPDITKAIELLSWQPKVSLDVGLLKTINYFKEVLCL
jgi:UDP-glucuronate decarboxylase